MPSAAATDPPACCSPDELSPCSACPPAPAQRRPKNTSPERLAQIAVGAMIQRIDDNLGLVQAAVLEELTDVFPGMPDDELSVLARSVGVRVVQCSLAAWFPEEFCDGDPAEYLAGRRAVLLRRAAKERRAGRTDEAAHWEAVAKASDIRSGLVPVSGTLERVSREGFVALVDKLKGRSGSMDGRGRNGT